DFRNIPVKQIAEHLASVVKTEKFKGDDELVFTLARLGNGSMRDALSLLDRLMASGENTLSMNLLEELLGLPDHALLSDLIDAIADGEPAVVLRSTATLLNKGISGEQLFGSLLERFRDLMVLGACGKDTDLVELSDDAREAEFIRSQRFDAAGVVHMIALCESVQRAVKSSPAPRALLDACMVRLAMTEKIADVAAFVASGGNAVKKA
ncbi:MAG: hypothetical protein JKY96_02050, partial [Phycisphaerales bacterium]|nr:hypothetical protein [Phycisphaerales bacterium]